MGIIDRIIIARYNRLLRKKQEGAHKSLIPEFIDSEGRRWFTYAKGETPVARMAKLKTYYDILSRGLSGEVIDTAFTAANECLAKGNIAEAGRVLCDLKDLKDSVVNMDAFINIIAVSYCREDEDPDTVTDHIHKEKIDFLMSETEAGRFFFRTAVWKDCERTFNLSSMDAEQLLTEYRAEMARLQRRWSVLASGKLSEK
jgi:hypothetical protein